MIDDRYRLDVGRQRAVLDQAAASFDQAAVLHQEVGDRLLERLQLIRLEPQRVLDLGCATGVVTAGLFKRYRKARVIGLEQSPLLLAQARRRSPWLRRLAVVCASANALPLAAASVDLVFSNLGLQCCDELDQIFAECWRVLRPGGLLLFSIPGPDTLQELRESWAAVDEAVHVHAFIDMHDIGDALVRSQFSDPVMDAENFTLTYPRLERLVADLRQLGAVNVAAGRPRGLTGRGRFQALVAAYERQRRDGLLPATVEVAYGHAWKPEQAVAQRRNDGTAVFPLAGLRGSRRGR